MMSKIAGAQFIADRPIEGGADWLADLRRTARSRYEAQGLPGPRVENWRFTKLRTLDAATWVAAAKTRLDALPDIAGGHDGPSIVLYQGRFQPHLSRLDGLAKGVSLSGLADWLATAPDAAEKLGRLALGEAMPLALLNTAYLSDGAVLIVDEGARMEAPIQILSLGAPNAGSHAVFHPRLLIVAGANSEATVIEHHLGAASGSYFTNSVAEIFVGKGARLRHTKIQNDAGEATHLAAAHLALEEGAAYEGFVLQLGAALARHEAEIRLSRDADCRISGAYLARGTQHIDTTIRIDHAEPGARSRQHVKGVLDDRAEGVFQGKITVQRDAQKSDGHQMSRALLLSPKARVSAKPELEIYADDVKCGHGATSGALSREALFYLTARGIEEKTARALLIGAFVDEVLEEIGDPDSRRLARHLVGDWLHEQIGHSALEEWT